MLDATDKNAAAGQRGSGPRCFVERVLTEGFKFRTGGEYVRRAGVVETEHLSVSSPRRRPKTSCFGNSFAIGQLAGLRIVAGEDSAALPQDVNVTLINQRRRLFRSTARDKPGNGSAGCIAIFERDV